MRKGIYSGASVFSIAHPFLFDGDFGMCSRYHGFALVSVIFTLLLAECGTGVAQTTGDRVVVTASSETKIFDKSVGKVQEGDIHTIEKIDGRWCKLDRVKGWLQVQKVMNLDSAMRHFTKRIEANPRDAVALAHRGMIHHELGRLAAAFTDLNSAVAIDRKNPATWMLRGIILNSQRKYVRASEDLNQSLELNPDDPNAHYNMGVVLYALENYAEAVKAYSTAIKLKPKNAMWYVNRGSARLGINEVDKAVEDYNQALKLDAGLADAKIGLCNVALIRGDLKEAFRAADDAVDLQPKNAMALNARGWVSYKLGNVEEAVYDLNRAVRYAPALSIAYGNRGVCYVSQNDFERAIADHSRHLKLSPGNPFALSNRAVAWLGKGEFQKAKDDFTAAEKVAPNLDEALNGFAWFLATCPEKSFRNGEMAIKKAKQACKISKNKNWYHLDTLAAAYAEIGDFENAVKYAKMALEVVPEAKAAVCQEHLKRFEQRKPCRSQVGKNAEQSIIGG